MRTHDVTNQPPQLVGYNTFEADRALSEALVREGAGWAEETCRALGERAGGEEAQRWGVEVNVNTPVLRTHDRYGNRIDEVEFHPSWHRLMDVAISNGLHALPWRDTRAGSHVARAAMFMTWQTDAGHGCPVSMTYSVIPALRRQPELASVWEPRFTSLNYDSRFIPASEKAGALCGMAMTEKQGGSDVRANTTRAEPANGGGPGAEYLVTGHKWFCSAPMCDAFLVLAQTQRGLSCFLMPRWLPDGSRNAFHIQRLKDKLGNRSNASSEVEFNRAHAWMVGEEGRGVPTIIEMVNHTRLDCVIGSAALMRQAVAQATHHASYRAAFGKTLVDQPLMRNVLADIAIESEAATVTMMRLARAYDAGKDDEREMLFKRLATAVSKYWICKRTPAQVAEALEVFGGNGFVEDSGMPRIYRESPLNSIWEGSGNVIALDALRAMAKTPASVEAFFAELDLASGADARLDAYTATVRKELTDDTEGIESRARRLVEKLALALQGSLLVRNGDPAVADAFCASRLEGDWGRAFGTLPSGIDAGAIVERARPKL
jgi:putative acyl-CoA dehydrogenase